MNLDLVNASTNIGGRIDSDSTWTKNGSPYTLTGNVLVSTDVTLTIEPGVTVNLNSYFILVNGTLSARGTSSEKIQFNGGTINFDDSSIDWNEQTGKGNVIEYANIDGTNVNAEDARPKISSCSIQSITISGLTIFSNNIVSKKTTVIGSPQILSNTFNGALEAGYGAGDLIVSNNIISDGVTIDGAASVFFDSNVVSGGLTVSSSNTSISNNEIFGGITAKEGTVVISGNNISRAETGLSLIPKSPVGEIDANITNNRITAQKTGIDIADSFSAFIYGWYVKAEISGNTIYNCASAGIKVGGASGSVGGNKVTIQNNVLYGNSYAINNFGTSQIEGNSVFNNYYGISGGTTVRNNIVEGNTYGISGGTVENNFVENNKYGIIGNEINSNTVIGNEVGIASGFSELHYNNVFNNTLNVNFTSSNDGNATYNWWGTTDLQAISQKIYDYNQDFTLGRVNFEPPLTALSTSAPSPTTTIPNVPTVIPQLTLPQNSLLLLWAVVGAVILIVAVILAFLVLRRTKRASPILPPPP